jgi:arsenate reductase
LRRDAMSVLAIYHNPKCSKSRAALDLLRGRGLQPQVIEYLKTPPSVAELRAIIDKLGITPEQLVRKGEQVYRERYAGKTLTDTQWIDAMVENPILIERPIVVSGDRAAIGRPLTNVLELIG